jgi:molecular chaperone GrpE
MNDRGAILMTEQNQDQDAVNKWQKLEEESQEQEPLVSDDVIAKEEAVSPEADIPGPSGSNAQDQIQSLEQKMAEYKEKALIAYAELENVRKRSDRDVENAHRYANEKLLADLLPVIDSLMRALEGEVSEDPQVQAMRQGVELTLDLLEKTLSRFGVEVVEPASGDAFNPDMHEAMSMIPDPKAESGAIVQLLQKGYRLNGRVVRAAMVVVAQ